MLYCTEFLWQLFQEENMLKLFLNSVEKSLDKHQRNR